MTKQSKPGTFNQLLNAAVDETLSGLGEKVRFAIYFHLENSFQTKKQDIPNNINGFSNALERLFGRGASHLEILIMKSLCNKLKSTCKWPTYNETLLKTEATDMTFQEYVRVIKQNFEGFTVGNELEMGVLSDGQAEQQRL